MSIMSALLGREQFRQRVFARDGGRCVFCGEPAVDAHHLLERKLFLEPDEAGGYFIENGISVCKHHHLECESTAISPAQGREAAGIGEVVVPHMLADEPAPRSLTKWGDPVGSDGVRHPGPLFFEPEVQAILRRSGQIGLYSARYRYPRTPHVPWSAGGTDDDRRLDNLDTFVGQEIVVTEKRDGQNISGYADGYIHARSLDSSPHRFETRVRAALAPVLPQLPVGWRICGENLQARHSIAYAHLPSYFAVFSIWNERNECLSWDETQEWCALLGLETVPVLYRGPYQESVLRGLFAPISPSGDEIEGWVMRTADGFAYRDFGRHVAKFVRAAHVRTNEHWTRSAMVENRLEHK
jgi:hypothetical protein